MSDMMTFPKTVEEFMEIYKVVDTEGVYMSKGAELVPIFRMRQWFEHLPSADVVPVVRCKDCEFFIEEERWCRRLGLCGAFDTNCYCSHAERRKNGR